MRAAERDGLLILLAAGSGSADGWSYFGMGHAFVANMTGNTVMLGVSVFHLKSDYLHPLVALFCYVAGTALGTLIGRRAPSGAVWTRSTSWILLLEGLLLGGVEARWVLTGGDTGHRAGLMLLGLTAVAIGLQSAAMIQLQVTGVVTTYITGTWTTLTHGVTLLASRQPRMMRDEKQFEVRFALQAAVLAAYFAAAVLTGWAFRHVPAAVGCIPSAAVLGAALYGMGRN